MGRGEDSDIGKTHFQNGETRHLIKLNRSRRQKRHLATHFQEVFYREYNKYYKKSHYKYFFKWGR